MKERITAPKWVCVLAIVMGAIAFGVQGAIDVYQFTQGVTDRVEFWAQVWSAVVPSGFGVVFSTIAGVLLYHRAWFRAGLLYLFVGVVMAITTLNGIDFFSNATVAKTVAAQKRSTVAKDVADIQTDNAKTERREMLDNLWRTYTVTKKPEEKEKILGQIKTVTDSPMAIPSPPVVEEVRTGGGLILNRRFGVSQEILQEIKSVLFPVITLIGKSLAITLGFALWPRIQLYEDRKPQKPRFFGLGAASNDQNVNQNVSAKSKEDALADLKGYFPTRAEDLTIAVLRRRWGVSKQSVYVWLKEWARQDLITLKYAGNKLYVASLGKPKMSVVSNKASA